MPKGINEDNKLTHQPIKTINVAIPDFQDSNIHGNFQDTPEDIQYLKIIITRLNEHYSYSVPTGMELLRLLAIPKLIKTNRS
ncbi:MAG: hypothetical protein WCX31_04350 [Salinivirgaceae bacterium]